MPPTALACDPGAASGKRRPQFTSAVVLPEPGAPMNMYQGSWYSSLPLDLPPNFCDFSMSSALEKRWASCSASSRDSDSSSPPDASSLIILRLRRRSSSTRVSSIAIHSSSSRMMTMPRRVADSMMRGWPTASSGPTNQTSKASTRTTRPPMASRFQGRDLTVLSLLQGGRNAEGDFHAAVLGPALGRVVGGHRLGIALAFGAAAGGVLQHRVHQALDVGGTVLRQRKVGGIAQRAG